MNVNHLFMGLKLLRVVNPASRLPEGSSVVMKAIESLGWEWEEKGGDLNWDRVTVLQRLVPLMDSYKLWVGPSGMVEVR